MAVGNSVDTPHTASGARTARSLSPTRQSTRSLPSPLSGGRSDYTPPYPQPIDSHTETSRSYLGSTGPFYARTSQLGSASSQLQPSTYSPGTDHSNYDHTVTRNSSPQTVINLEDIDPEVSSEISSWADRRTISLASRTEFSNSIVSPFGLENQLGFGDRHQERASDDSSHSSSMRTRTASAQGNDEDFISDIVWNEPRHSPENEVRQPVGRPVTMEDGSDDDGPTMATTMGQRSVDGIASDAGTRTGL